ncbi:hypothetical protein BDA96_02G289600 [Sorghum bicolor]|uniref:Uncharacterized protein n=1 Tax=Sorghum bicolor TaxID=4558 RepID=A0A921RQB9_SORBI|nr:hypothetical protein BDA96_02G289600 [Sorghum bicolor]
MLNYLLPLQDHKPLGHSCLSFSFVCLLLLQNQKPLGHFWFSFSAVLPSRNHQLVSQIREFPSP